MVIWNFGFTCVSAFYIHVFIVWVCHTLASLHKLDTLILFPSPLFPAFRLKAFYHSGLSAMSWLTPCQSTHPPSCSSPMSVCRNKQWGCRYWLPLRWYNWLAFDYRLVLSLATLWAKHWAQIDPNVQTLFSKSASLSAELHTCTFSINSIVFALYLLLCNQDFPDAHFRLL